MATFKRQINILQHEIRPIRLTTGVRKNAGNTPFWQDVGKMAGRPS